MKFINITELKEQLQYTKQELLKYYGDRATKNRLVLSIVSAQNKLENEYNHRNKDILLKFLYKAKYIYLPKYKKENY